MHACDWPTISNHLRPPVAGSGTIDQPPLSIGDWAKTAVVACEDQWTPHRPRSNPATGGCLPRILSWWTVNRGAELDESSRNSLVTRWQRMLDAIERIGGETQPLVVEPPAREKEVQDLERRMGEPVPASLRDVLLTFSRKVDFFWQLPQCKLPQQLGEMTSGDCRWSLEDLARINVDRNIGVFPDPDDPYDSVWHNKFFFSDIGNGDVWGIDVRPHTFGSVVYLSHDEGEGHGRHVGADFQDFVFRWTRLGCVGGDDWMWLPFAPNGGYLDPNCDLAVYFRSFLQVDL